MTDQHGARLLAEQVDEHAKTQGASGQIDVSSVLVSGSPNTDRAGNIILGGAAGRIDNGEGVQHGQELPHLAPRFGQEDEVKSVTGQGLQNGFGPNAPDGSEF
jgi:hypothetical protein